MVVDAMGGHQKLVNICAVFGDIYTKLCTADLYIADHGDIIEITEPQKSAVLKDVYFKSRVNAALPIPRQPYTKATLYSSSPSGRKNTVHCLVQKIAFAWVKTGRKLRLERVVLLG